MKINMEKAVANLSDSIIGIRGGTTSPGMIDTVKVPCYGQMTPIKHIAFTGKIGDAIHVDPYDASQTNQIAKSLTDAGFSAYAFSKTRVLVSVPPPSGDQKKETIAHLKKLSEDTKIAIRNIRKKFRQKQDSKDLDAEIQKITDSYIAEVDDIINRKIAGL
jgi:ribosome recycling factor